MFPKINKTMVFTILLTLVAQRLIESSEQGRAILHGNGTGNGVLGLGILGL